MKEGRNGGMDGCMDERIFIYVNSFIHVWMGDGWMDGRTEGNMHT